MSIYVRYIVGFAVQRELQEDISLAVVCLLNGETSRLELSLSVLECRGIGNKAETVACRVE
jgi:hypothetical protein